MNSFIHFIHDTKEIQKKPMRGSNFIFDSVQLMYYKCRKINFRPGGSYNNSPDWVKKKKATINP